MLIPSEQKSIQTNEPDVKITEFKNIDKAI